MTAPSAQAKKLLPLTAPVYFILLALEDKDQHGYGIITEVAARTNGEVKIRTGTLYTAIRRMLGQGLIEEIDERPDPALDDERRKYYRITPFGRELVRAEARRLDQMVTMARAKHVLAGHGDAASAVKRAADR